MTAPPNPCAGAAGTPLATDANQLKRVGSVCTRDKVEIVEQQSMSAEVDSGRWCTVLGYWPRHLFDRHTHTHMAHTQ